MHETLPGPLREWVIHRAGLMGLPGPDDYILLLIRLEKQRQESAALDSPNRSPDAP